MHFRSVYSIYSKRSWWQAWPKNSLILSKFTNCFMRNRIALYKNNSRAFSRDLWWYFMWKNAFNVNLYSSGCLPGIEWVIADIWINIQVVSSNRQDAIKTRTQPTVGLNLWFLFRFTDIKTGCLHWAAAPFWSLVGLFIFAYARNERKPRSHRDLADNSLTWSSFHFRKSEKKRKIYFFRLGISRKARFLKHSHWKKQFRLTCAEKIGFRFGFWR